MIAEFIAGLLVGTLLGLALAPLLRSWVLWKMTESWRPVDRARREKERTGRR
jgi:hypothetical protein